MASVATVLAVFAMVLMIGLVLRRRSERRLAALAEAADNEPDPRDLADPNRWPTPPPAPPPAEPTDDGSGPPD